MTPAPQAGYSKRSRLDKVGVKPDMVRAAALAQDLVDAEVIAFSETLSGLALVIQVAKR